MTTPHPQPPAVVATAGQVPLLVRAHLAGSVAHAAPWGVSLDGLLAAQLWAEEKTAQIAAGHPPEPMADLAYPKDLILPLARCQGPDRPLWHWAATTAWPDDAPEHPTAAHTWTARLDHRAIETLTDSLPATVSDSRGRYRAYRMPLLVTTATSLVWRAVGDPSAIEALLRPLTAIGKKRSAGEGHVLRWSIHSQPQADPWAAAHLHPDGTLGRPTPPGCLHQHPDIVDGGTGTAGLRPPYMHPSRQHELHLPALLDEHAD